MGTQLFCETFLLRALVQIGDVPEGFRLLAQGTADFWMGMPQIANGDSGYKIKIGMPF